MKAYTATYARDRENWWVATVRGVSGVHAQGRSLDEARRRVREALSVAIGEARAARAHFVDEVKLPAHARRTLAVLAKALAREAAARASARKAALAATRALTNQLKLSRRDAAALTGYSFQRIQQLAARA